MKKKRKALITPEKIVNKIRRANCRDVHKLKIGKGGFKVAIVTYGESGYLHGPYLGPFNLTDSHKVIGIYDELHDPTIVFVPVERIKEISILPEELDGKDEKEE